MTHIGRRSALLGLTAIAGARAATPATVLRVGTQKGGPILTAERQRRGLEAAFAPLGVEVQWQEFQFGPPIMEALRIGSIDIGYAGDAPPIFAQATRTDLVYVAAVPGSPEAILLPPGSSLQSLADLRGKRIAYSRGSSAHNVTIAALEKAGLGLEDVRQTPLAPADAAAAFERGAIDAWTVWDPYYAIFETRPGVRVLATSDGIAPQNSFILGNRVFVDANPALTETLFAELVQISDWAAGNRQAVARLIVEATGIPPEAASRAMNRYPFKTSAMSDEHVRSQQDIADRFTRLGVLPTKIDIASRVWRPRA